MRVKDLIRRLEKMDPESPVEAESDDGVGNYPVTEVYKEDRFPDPPTVVIG